jgi:hypothetical protein
MVSACNLFQIGLLYNQIGLNAELCRMSAMPSGPATPMRVADRSTRPRAIDEFSLDTAIAAAGKLLPDYGFKLVLPPPLADGTRPEPFASAWRRGETRAATYSAATPALALLKAAQCERDKLGDRDRLQSCSHCRGVGWYIATGGIRYVCRHDQDKSTAPGREGPGAVRP